MVTSLSEHGTLTDDFARLISKAVRGAFERATGKQVDKPANLRDWAKRFMPESFDTPSSSLMHDWMFREFDRCDVERGRRINVEAPRGNAKSELATAYILKSVLEAREPYVWIISDSNEQANGLLANVTRNLEDNPLLSAAYPEACGRGRRWSMKRIELRNGTRIEAFGMGQKLRGRKHGSKRPTLIVCDDLQNDNIATSSVRREKETRWFRDVPLKAGTKATNVIVVGTSLHREAIVVQNRNKPGWDVARFSAIVEWPKELNGLWLQWAEIYRDRDTYGNDAPRVARKFYEQNRRAMDDGAVVLWPERESLYELMCQREQDGPSSFEREKQCNPVSPESSYFPAEWFDDPTVYFDHFPANAKVWAMALDPSLGNTDHSDFSAYVWGMVDHNATIYVDASIQRRTVPLMVSDGIDIWKQIMPSGFFLEANHFQGVLVNQFVVNGVPIGVTKITNTENKEVRIRRLEPFLNGRQIRFRRRSRGAALLVEQLRQFPNGSHDDGPDCLELFIRGLLSMQRRAA